MKEQRIWAHTLVRNEERYLWYAVMSVINRVDKILLWDMESTDDTPMIIKELEKKYPKKISSKIVSQVTPDGFPKIRQAMLDETNADWFLVVDGDEVWWDDSIQKVVNVIRDDSNYESIVVPIINVVGDIYHYQEEKAGLYNLAGKKGHLSIRAIKRNIPGLSSSKPHGTWGWTDKDGKMIQDRNQKQIHFLDAPYIHTTYLTRSANRQLDEAVIKRAQKYKYELGIPFAKDFYYPEVFFIERPDFVASPWVRMESDYIRRALVETPLRKIKRRLIPARSGY